MGTVFSQDGQHLVSVSRDRSVKLTEVPTNRFIDNVTSITPGALKGGLLALDLRPPKDPRPDQASEDGDSATPRCRAAAKLRGAVIAAVAARRSGCRSIPPDAKDVPAKLYDEILVAGADGQPRLYKMHREVEAGDRRRLQQASASTRSSPAGSTRWRSTRPAGTSRPAAAWTATGEARVYEADTGKRVSTFEAVKTPVYAVAFRPDGKWSPRPGSTGWCD